MGQGEVIDFLKDCDKPVTRREIAEGIDCDPIKVSHILPKLLKTKEIDFIEHARERASELVGYILLRRTRFFFLIERIEEFEELEY